MATNVWEGSAAAVAQVDTLTPGGTIEADDIFIVTINGKSVSAVAGGTAVADVCDAVTAAFNASTEPEFAELTAADATAYVTLTSDTAGVPFTVTVSTTEAGGGAADLQTFTRAASVANSGPNDANVATNWSTGSVPGADEIVFEDSTVSCLYQLDQIGAVTSCTVKSTFTGYIGLPHTNAHLYAEYRPTALDLGTAMATIDVGQGNGAGSGRINLAVGNRTAATSITVYKTGSRASSRTPSLLLTTGTQSDDTTLVVNHGDVGVAVHASDTAVIDTLKMGYVSSMSSDAKVTCGSGVTLTTVAKGGGILLCDADITTLTQNEGTTTLLAAATLTTGTLNGGTLYYNSSGTFTTMHVAGGATLDFRQDARGRTGTTTTIYQNGTIRDPAQTVTWTNGIAMSYCGLADITLDIGEGKTITLS